MPRFGFVSHTTRNERQEQYYHLSRYPIRRQERFHVRRFGRNVSLNNNNNNNNNMYAVEVINRNIRRINELLNIIRGGGGGGPDNTTTRLGGLSEEKISKTLRIQAVATGDDDICAICLAEFEDNNMTGTLACGHSYHVQCIKDWLLLKNVCPLCRATAL